jgi:hypothetical protein
MPLTQRVSLVGSARAETAVTNPKVRIKKSVFMVVFRGWESAWIPWLHSTDFARKRQAVLLTNGWSCISEMIVTSMFLQGSLSRLVGSWPESPLL